MNSIIGQHNFLETRTERELGQMVLAAAAELFKRKKANQFQIIVRDDNAPVNVLIAEKI